MQKNLIPRGYFMCCAFPEPLHITAHVSDTAPITHGLSAASKPIYTAFPSGLGAMLLHPRLPSCQDWTKRNFFVLCTPISFPSQCIYAPRIQRIPLNQLAMKAAKKAFDIHSGQFNRP